MNSKKHIYINKKQNYYWIRVQSYQRYSNINPNNKEPDKKNKWKIILGRKGLDLPLRIQKDKIKYNNNKPITHETRTILLTSINDPNDTKLFFGIR